MPGILAEDYGRYELFRLRITNYPTEVGSKWLDVLQSELLFHYMIGLFGNALRTQ